MSDTIEVINYPEEIIEVANETIEITEVVERGLPGAPASISDAAYNGTSWNDVATIAPSKNAVRDIIESILLTLSSVASSIGSLSLNKQDISEKDQANGYVGLQNNGFIATAVTGWEREVSTGDHELRATKIISKEWASETITSGRFLRIDKQDGYSNIRVNSWDDVPIVDSIWSEYGGDYIDGDEILAVNTSNNPIQIRADGPTSEGIPIYTNEFGTPMLWPADQAVKFIRDTALGKFRAIPMFNFAELSFGLIDGNYDVDADNFHQWHGKLNSVSDNYTITFYASVPDGFRADFEANTPSDVTFAVAGGTINNRQSHTKIAGRYGVVTVYKRNGEFYLVGDTKA